MSGFWRRQFLSLSLFFFIFIPALIPLQQTSNSSSEIGFVVYSQNTFYGLNLDNSRGEIRFRVETDRHRVMFIDVNIDGSYYTVGAVSDQGIFVLNQNLIGIDPSRRTPTAEFGDIFGNLFFSRSKVIPPQSLDLQNNSWLLDNTQQLFTDESADGYMVETINGVSTILPREDNYMILTGLPASANFPAGTTDFYHPHQQRLRVEEEIRKHVNEFSIMDGFDALRMAQPNQDMIASIVMDPTHNRVYLAFDKDYTKIWMIDLDGATIETYAGFERYHKGNVPDIGITASDLRILNFSNEGLMVRIIFGAIGILFIILITLAFNLQFWRTQKSTGQ